LAPATAPAESAPAISSSSVATTQVSAAGSSDTPPASTTKASQKHAPAAAPDAKSGDVIRVGEMVHIVFTDTPQPIPPVDDKVKDDGTITLMFDKTFQAAGKTPGELAQEIRKRYVPDYFAQLTATVVRDILRAYYVDGEVRNPSKQAYTGPMTLTQAIASAGGFTDFADKKRVKLIRANGKSETVNCKKLIDHPELDPEVFPGDKVHVPRSIL
jgi:polysaccharide export outer membrane protein